MMNFKNVVAVQLFLVCCIYTASATFYVHKHYPAHKVSCMTADCYMTKTRYGDDMMYCNKTYFIASMKRLIEEEWRLLPVEKGGEDYYVLDKNDRKTGKTAKLAKKDDITIHIGRNADGSINEICCASEAEKQTEEIKDQLKKHCQFKDKHLEDVDNEHCAKK